MAYFSVDILTPSSVLAKEVEVDSLTVPTVGGEINVLPEHTHVVSKLDTGILVLNTKDSKLQFSMTSGVCKVLDKKVIILSTTSEKAQEIDKNRAEKALEKAQKKLSGKEALTGDELVKYQRKLERAKMRIRLAEFYLR